jgi:nucleotide-binding universal stress UspA family protein
MFQRILIAWDGSRAALRALEVSLDVARRYEAELTAVSVAYSPAHAETEEDRAESAQAARRHLEETFARVRDRADRIGVPVEQVVIDGDQPGDDLLAYAHEHGFDLVVAGHHRSSRAGRLFLHGVPERLAAAAEVPVMIVGDQDAAARGR